MTSGDLTTIVDRFERLWVRFSQLSHRHPDDFGAFVRFGTTSDDFRTIFGRSPDGARTDEEETKNEYNE